MRNQVKWMLVINDSYMLYTLWLSGLCIQTHFVSSMEYIHSIHAYDIWDTCIHTIHTYGLEIAWKILVFKQVVEKGMIYIFKDKFKYVIEKKC